MTKPNPFTERDVVSEVFDTFRINKLDLGRSSQSKFCSRKIWLTYPKAKSIWLTVDSLDLLRSAFGSLVDMDHSNPCFASSFVEAYGRLESSLLSFLDVLRIHPGEWNDPDDGGYHERVINAFRHDGKKNPLSHLLGVDAAGSRDRIMNGDSLREMVHGLRDTRNRLSSAQKQGNGAPAEAVDPFPRCSSMCFYSRTLGMMLAALVVCVRKSYPRPEQQHLTIREVGCVTRTCIRLIGDDHFCQFHKKFNSGWLAARVKNDDNELMTMLRKSYFTCHYAVGEPSVDTGSCETEPLCTIQGPEVLTSKPSMTIEQGDSNSFNAQGPVGDDDAVLERKTSAVEQPGSDAGGEAMGGCNAEDEEEKNDEEKMMRRK